MTDVYGIAFRHKTPGEGVGGFEWDVSLDAAKERIATGGIYDDPHYETYETTFYTDFSEAEIRASATVRNAITDELDARFWGAEWPTT